MTKKELKYSLPLDFIGLMKTAVHFSYQSQPCLQIQISEIYKTTESHFLSAGYYQSIRNAI